MLSDAIKCSPLFAAGRVFEDLLAKQRTALLEGFDCFAELLMLRVLMAQEEMSMK